MIIPKEETAESAIEVLQNLVKATLDYGGTLQYFTPYHAQLVQALIKKVQAK